MNKNSIKTIIDGIEIIVWVKRVTFIINGKSVFWSCYDIVVPLAEIQIEFGYETKEKCEQWILNNSEYLESSEPLLFLKLKITNN